MKISSSVATGHGPIPGAENVLVNVNVEMDGPIEAMTISVIVPNQGTDEEKSQAGIRRAQALARQFSDLPS